MMHLAHTPRRNLQDSIVDLLLQWIDRQLN